MPKAPIRVLVDGFYLSKPRGLGRYVRELLYALDTNPAPDVEIHVLLPRGLDSASLPRHENLICHRMRALPFPLWEQLQVPYFCRRLGAEILHSGFNTMPVVFRQWPGQVQTIQDLMFLNPEVPARTFYQWVGKVYRAVVVAMVRGGRQCMLSTTETIAREIASKLGRVATPINISLDLFRSTPRPDQRPLAQPYFLHIGGTQAHKNTVRCVEAFLAGAPPEYSLVIAGVPAGWDVDGLARNPRILVPGWISDFQLAGFYKYAAGVVFPSLNEGFGLPVIEAFAYGIPLITSDRDPMRELAGDAALLVDPLNIGQMAEAIGSLVRDEALRNELIRRGSTRAGRFDGKVIAAKVLDVYRTAARGTR